MSRLVFSLAANIAAAGGQAGNNVRPTMNFPGRSALIGLIGAALGRKRDDDFSDLETLSFSIIVFNDGTLLRDFQTVHSTTDNIALDEPTRPHILKKAYEENQLITSLDERMYRCGVFYGIVADGDDALLATIKEALNTPIFPLYLGRKCCSLSVPVDAHIVNSATLTQAAKTIKSPAWLGHQEAQYIISDYDDGESVSRNLICDVLNDRSYRHFGMRYVYVYTNYIEIGCEYKKTEDKKVA